MRSRTITTRSASSRSASICSTAPGAPAGSAATVCGATVSSARSQCRRASSRQAAAPAHAGQRDRVAGRDRDAVRGQRLAGAGGDAGHHVVAALGAGREDRGGADAVGRVGHDARPGVGREARQPVVAGDVDDVDGELAGSLVGADQQRLHGPAQRAGDGDGLQRRLVAGRISTRFIRPPRSARAGRRRRARRRRRCRGSRPAWTCPPAPPVARARGARRGGRGVVAATGFDFARMRPGTDG